ncbi:hypothetical protein Pla123a_32370 [Posidoniimonas polymericola]|uniref:Uncharacterized protein n=1 Tax=Posidoniimonas polymericola TaxID=2528002 RepID=A0A5C5YLN1_9BACT|nr:DUF5695 domain-containing protein [Posidoniimonas polymericola]TWT75727.1 hypothetical protein Pla123a_32370 [Posidoniimonas polymericola]
MLFAIACERRCRHLSVVPLLTTALLCPGMPAVAAVEAPPSDFELEWNSGHVTSLRRRDDAFDTPYLRAGSRLGDVVLRYRDESGPWIEASTRGAQRQTQASASGAGARVASYRITRDGKPALEIGIETEVSRHAVTLRATVKNLAGEQVEIGDLAVPLPMNTQFQRGSSTSSVLKHSFVSGHGSFFYWMRSNSVGPYLLMTPSDDTSLEYWTAGRRDNDAYEYWVYAHSRAAGEEASHHGGTWRQPHTACRLDPLGGDRDSSTYSFRFEWVEDHSAVRDALYANGLVDVQVAPGMTIPSDLDAELALRSRVDIKSIVAEYPEQTNITELPSNGDYKRFRVRFHKLGENRLTVNYGDNRHVHLEYFSTEPLEKLIKKRGRFIAGCQHLASEKWYNGLLSEWNMESATLLGPDNYDKIKGWRIYEVSCDDPGLCKPAFLAAKNSLIPRQEEVRALDEYIEHFVWGRLQRTTKESHSYGIYGIPDWKQNRDSNDPGSKGKLHLWRTYDYPHVVLIYYHMHLLARDHPEIETKLSSDEYLERAYGTARAMFTVPWSIVEWSGYTTGYYNELVLVDLIDALEAAGKTSESDLLRQCWEAKVRFFVGGKADWFQSEYAFDSTGFESTHALAKYALSRVSSGVDLDSLGYTADQARDFMDAQMQANLFCRGVIEPAYYYLGSDYRGRGGDAYTLSYMSQMGGWAVLDYGLCYAEHPSDYLRLGYASVLSSWALMNTGTEESNYGYWFPGKENDGGAGGGFEPAISGKTWLEQPHHRGSWYYACEIDLGYCAALRAARTILSDDPVFGRICFGGSASNATDDAIGVVPRDGVRRRFSALIGGRAFHLELKQNRFAKAQAILVKPELSRISFRVEADAPDSRRIQILFCPPAPGVWVVGAQGGSSKKVVVPNHRPIDIAVEVDVSSGQWITIAREG